MSTLHSSLYAVAIMSCLLCSLLASGSAQSRQRIFYLGTFLALESTGFGFEWLMLNPESPAKSLWLGSLMALSFLLAPCLWLYSREISETERPKIRTLPPRHLAVVALGMLLTLPLIQTAHLGSDYANPAAHPSELRILFVTGTMLAAVIVFLLQAAWYLKASHDVLVKQTQLAKPLFAAIECKTSNSLRLLIWVVATHWFVNALRAVHCMTLGKDTGLGVLFAFLQVAVTIWAILSLLRSSAVLSFEQVAAVAAAKRTLKYERSALDHPARSRIQRKLQAAMSEHRLYADSQLSLRSLCDHLNENPHYVSQVLNQDLSTTFNDLVNQHRIEAAKTALATTPGKSVLEICLEAGFNSKSTFNVAFRERTGMTPSEYRKQRSRPMSDPAGSDARATFKL